MHITEKPLSALWQDYLFLTTEMGKFLDKQDFDLFLELLSQREGLQSMIENKQNQLCTELPIDEGLLVEIDKANQVVNNKLRYAMNMEDKQQNISRAYDGYSSPFVGSRMDWKR